MKHLEKIKNKLGAGTLLQNVFLDNDAEVFSYHMGMKYPFPVSLKRIDSLITSPLDFCRLAAPSETNTVLRSSVYIVYKLF